MHKRQFLAICLATVIGTSSASVSAQEAASEDVYFVDLDLRSDTGVKSLDARIKKAVRRVCGGVPRGGFYEWRWNVHCKKETLASVIPLRDAAILKARSKDGPIGIAAISVTPSIPRR
ncbi:UrcA family protein [Altererythrobacter aurantiacus]|uniref:UrcA family protein n=1 Tax=Parapontixanthobacter aurantiacus TaxID=1463599 RepID=A0A844ZFW7_9SPHN|nr:UrcA family protein [Parapontixanthobacter aurantiacus]